MNNHTLSIFYLDLMLDNLYIFILVAFGLKRRKKIDFS